MAAMLAKARSWLFDADNEGRIPLGDEEGDPSSFESPVEEEEDNWSRRKRLWRKYRTIVLLSLLLVVLLMVAVLVIKLTKKEPPPLVIVISFDGLRASYLRDSRFDGVHPTFDEFAKAGASMPIQPVFPSLTFPNHYTLATGLYAESHGIVANDFYDPALNESFTMSSHAANSDGKWWLGEPIWITAVKQKLVSAVYFWPGSEAKIDGRHATYWFNFSESTPYSTRVNQAITWAHMPEDTRPSLIMLYFQEVDHAGHVYGPDNTTAIRAALKVVDDTLAQIRDGVKDVPNISWVLVSDHGMAELVSNGTVLLPKLPGVNNTLLAQTRVPARSGTLLHLWPPAGQETTLQQQISAGLNATQANATCWLKSQIPARFHYQKSNRIPPVVALADLGYYASSSNSFYGSYMGNHGYDNFEKDMRGIFIAKGDNFLEGYDKSDEPLPNINVYNILCSLLGLNPAPNNGSDPASFPFWKS